jgi:hypothetical protein
MPGGGGEQFLKSLQYDGLLTTMPVIILTAYGTGPNAMQASKLGAYDFITKPLDIDLALASVARAVRHMELQREVELLRQQRFSEKSVEDLSEPEGEVKPQLVGNSPAWIEVFKTSAELPQRMSASCCWGNLAQEKKSLPARFIKTTREVVTRSSSSVQLCLPNYWCLNSSDMNAVPSPAQSLRSAESLKPQTAEPSSWMKLESYRCRSSRSSCGFYRSTPSSGLAEQLPYMRMSELSPEQIVPWRTTWSRRPFVPTSFIA